MPPKKIVAVPTPAPVVETIVPQPPAEEPKKEKAPRKPRAKKDADEEPVAPPPINAIDDADEPEEPVKKAEKIKAPRKPRAKKAIEEAREMSTDESEKETEVTEVLKCLREDILPEPPAKKAGAEKAPRKPRAKKAVEEAREIHTDESEKETEVEEVVKPAPKARGRPRKQPAAEGDAKPIPTHDMKPGKANPKVKASGDEDNAPAKRKKREPKLDDDGNVIKRAPTEYNKFMSKTLLALKEEYKDYEVKPNQKELMTEAAAKWRAHKALLPPI